MDVPKGSSKISELQATPLSGIPELQSETGFRSFCFLKVSPKTETFEEIWNF